MKIYSISRIKNEEDIIESFIRYHLNIIDEMVIIEDYSSDETYNILKKLQDEGLPIHIYRNSKKPIPQQDVINNAYNIALNDFHADLVVPLDCDEFLVCKDGGNPRDILEKLPQDKYFQVYWRTYLPDLDAKSFSLNQLKIIRDPVIDDRSKIIIPSKLNEKYEIVLTPGFHSLEDKDIPFEELDELRIAHIPIRNKSQCISKATVSWLNSISNFYKDPRASWHQNIMFEILRKSNGKLTDQQVMDYAKSYSSRKSFDITTGEFEQPFDTSFCENITLKYTTDYAENEFVKLLEFSENLALNYGNIEHMLTDMNEDIINESNYDSDYLYNLEDAYTHNKRDLYFLKNDLVIRSKKYTGKIELKNQRINELKDIVSDKNERISDLNKIVSDKNDRIIELKTIVSQKNERIEELKDIVSAKNDRIIELKDTVSTKNNRITELKDIVSRKDDNVNRVRKENEKLTKINNDMKNSKSWKITKPLRKL